jgi:hypothetical protein
MADPSSRWPFGATDGGPDSRPLVVDLENVLIAILANDDAGEAAEQALHAVGHSDENVRRYTSEQILAYDEAFRSGRGLKERVVGALVDDGDSMDRYVQYAREGCSALWILTRDRDDANRLIRHLADDEIVFVWFHGSEGLETMRVR